MSRDSAVIFARCPVRRACGLNSVVLGAIAIVVAAVGSPSEGQTPSSPEDHRIAPRILPPQRDASEYYPPASLRIGETGRVVLRFSVDAAGKAVEPFTVDNDQSLTPSERLIVAAEDYLKDSRFDTRADSKKVLEASFVFEFAPCGELGHSLVHDYTINLCRDKPAVYDPPIPGAAVTTIK
jgi:hypothetical protein